MIEAALLLPALRADFAVGEIYGYDEEPALSCPISAYVRRDDRHFFPQTAAPAITARVSADLIETLALVGSE